MGCELNRRGFLKRAGATAAVGLLGFPVIVPASARGAQGRLAPSDRIALGFVGLGGHGRGVNLKNFMVNANVQVAALCDVDRRNLGLADEQVIKHYSRIRAKGAAAGERLMGDFRELIDRADIDAVVVSTPDHWHVPISVAAIRAGKDVYCEKPLTLTIKEGRILSDTVKRYGRIFQTGSEFRGAYNFHRAAELVRNGRIGKLKRMWTYLPMSPGQPGNQTPMAVPKELDYEMWLGPSPWQPYTKDRVHFTYRWILDYSGGLLCDWGGHLNDQAQWGNNSEYSGPVEIEGQGEFLKDGLYDTAVRFHIEYTYTNGVQLICTDQFGQYGGSIRYEGTEGTIFARYSGYQGRNITAQPGSILDSVIGPEETHLYTCRFGPERNFLDCVTTRKETYYPAEVGHRSATVCHLGNIAMQLGRKLKWDPVHETFKGDEQANRMRSRAMRSPWTL